MPDSRAERHAKRAERRVGRVCAVPLPLLDTVTRRAIAAYVALCNFARPAEGDPRGNPDVMPFSEALDYLSAEDRQLAEKCLDSDVWFCWPSWQTVADDTPPATPGGTRPHRETVKRWIAELEEAGWVLSFNRSETVDGRTRNMSNLFLLAKRDPWPVELRTGGVAQDPGVPENPGGGVPGDPQNYVNHEQRTNPFGIGGVEEKQEVEEIDIPTFAASLHGLHGTPGSANTPHRESEAAFELGGRSL